MSITHIHTLPSFIDQHFRTAVGKRTSECQSILTLMQETLRGGVADRNKMYKSFTSWMPFLPPNKQSQSTEGIDDYVYYNEIIIILILFQFCWCRGP